MIIVRNCSEDDAKRIEDILNHGTFKNSPYRAENAEHPFSGDLRDMGFDGTTGARDWTVRVVRRDDKQLTKDEESLLKIHDIIDCFEEIKRITQS